MNLLIIIPLLLFSVAPISGVVRLIFDTDMDFDVDDVGALCAAHGLVRLGEAEILAVGEALNISKQRFMYNFQFSMSVILEPLELCQ